MRAAVTGANGAVGQAILRSAPAVELVAVVRSERAAAELRPRAGAARVVRLSYEDATGLGAAFEGATAVVHLAGVLVERPGSRYEDANVESTRRVAAAAKRAGVDKLVLVSAVGADPRSRNRYWRTKGEAEALVHAAGLAYTILRVPMLLGRGTEAALALRRRLARRTVALHGGGRTRQQPLAVDDVARAALRACDPGVATDRTLELVGPTPATARELVERAACLGARRVRIVSLPLWSARLALAIVRRAGGRGFSPDALEVLTTDTTVDPAPAARALGIALTPLDDMIRDSVQP
jgi:NADH dehydrogenase